MLAPSLLVAAAATIELSERLAPRVPHVAAEMSIDGRLDEPAWARALVIALDVETRPGENIAPPVETDALLLDTGAALLVAFRARDPDPGSIRAYLHDRDAAYRDDFVGVALDTFNDQRRALQFFANPFGAQMDMINDDVNQREDDSWDAIWESAGRIHAHGYTVEMEIPYTALQLPGSEGEQVWGIDLLRFYPRTNRHRISNNPQDRAVSCYLCQLGKVRGFEGADAGLDIEVTPTLTVVASERRDAVTDAELVAADADVEPGLDVTWGITPNLNLSATLNPDFSQVEADVAQLAVNQTFALFFPEQRPFFLEGQDFFQSPSNLVFTRNVADPDFGVRLTGKAGRHGLGFFAADDRATNVLVPGALGSSLARIEAQSRNAVARYRYDVGDNSSVGLISTVRDGEGYRNVVLGADAQLRFSDADRLTLQFLDTATAYPDEIAADLDQPRGEFGGQARRLAYDRETRDWYGFFNWDDFDAGFRADLGFVNRVDYTKGVIGGGRVWHGEPGDWYERIQLHADYDETHDQSGLLLEREIEGNLRLNGPLQSFLRLGGGRRDRFWDGELFDERFYTLYGEVQPRAGVYLELFARFGDQVDFANTRLAEITRLSPEVRLNVGRGWQFELRHTFEELTRDGGTVFSANQSDFRVAYQFDLRQRLRLTVQRTAVERDPALYRDPVDAATRELGTQLIYSYKVNPRTVLFAGYSDAGLANDRVTSLTTMNRTAFLKVGYAWEPSI